MDIPKGKQHWFESAVIHKLKLKIRSRPLPNSESKTPGKYLTKGPVSGDIPRFRLSSGASRSSRTVSRII
jgi:hypothetical protein